MESFTDVGQMDMYSSSFQTYQTGMEQYNSSQMIPAADFAGGVGVDAAAAEGGLSGQFAGGARGRGIGRPHFRQKSPKAPKPMLYCEICKISCAGAQPYAEHMNGQKHKKKEALMKTTAAKAATSASSPASANQLYCKLCDVSCGSQNTYDAHICGAKHLRVLNLHSTLGKPIPEGQSAVAAATSGAGSGAAAGAGSAAPTGTATAGSLNASADATNVDSSDKAEQGEVIGAEYIEEIKNDRGVVVSFTCKLCDCSFTDPNSNLVHLKGRRHRLQYKKKVDNSFYVEMRPSARAQKSRNDKMKRLSAKEEFWRQQDEMIAMRHDMMSPPIFGGGCAPGNWMWQDYGRNWNKPAGRSSTLDDRYMLNKHSLLYPQEKELETILTFVVNCEKALKLVSDVILLEDDAERARLAETGEQSVVAEVKIEVKIEEGKEESANQEKTKESTKPTALDESNRSVKGAMRIEHLAKALLLRGDLDVQLVLLSSEKPTALLLQRIFDHLPGQLQTICPNEKFDVSMSVDDCGLVITREEELRVMCFVTLTSPLMNEENLPDKELVKPDPVDMLNKQKCLEALAALRRAKWFQVRASGLKNGLIVMRILRDLRRRNPIWMPLSEWAYELLVEKCIFIAGTVIGPGEVLRSFFECISSGILLPGGYGIVDPCEKVTTDVVESLTLQEREAITLSAQTVLRQIVYRQIHKILDVDRLPKRKFQPYKRRRQPDENSTGIDDKKMKEDVPEVSEDVDAATSNGTMVVEEAAAAEEGGSVETAVQ